MEFQKIDPEEGTEVLVEDPPAPPEAPAPRKKRRLRWLAVIPVVLALALAALGGYLYANRTVLALRRDPAQAILRGLSQAAPLPDPGVYGVLGEVSRGGVSANCAGSFRLQVTEEGLTVLAEDFSLSDRLTDVSFYLSPHDAALIAPELTGGDSGWYGVSLDRPIRDQTAGTGGDPDYGWYFDEGAIAAFQTAADSAREALGAVTAPGLNGEEAAGLETLLEGLAFTVTDEGGVWRLEGAGPAEGARQLLDALGLGAKYCYGTAELACELDRETGALLWLEVRVGDSELLLHLGSAPWEELTPYLSVTLATEAGSDFTADLAITVQAGEAPRRPDYANAFDLLIWYPEE